MKLSHRRVWCALRNKEKELAALEEKHSIELEKALSCIDNLSTKNIRLKKENESLIIAIRKLCERLNEVDKQD